MKASESQSTSSKGPESEPLRYVPQNASQKISFTDYILQARTVKLLSKFYPEYDPQPFVLMQDPKLQLEATALRNFVSSINRDSTIGVSGITYQPSNFGPHLMLSSLIQDELMANSMTAALGGIRKMQGGSSLLRLDALANLGNEYFDHAIDHPNFDCHKVCMGDERYLAQLALTEYTRRNIGFCPGARSTIDSMANASKFKSYSMKTFLGNLANDAETLTMGSMWIKRPFLLLHNFTTFSTSSIAFLLTILIWTRAASFQWSTLQTVLTFLPFLINWVACIVFASLMGHPKLVMLHPISLITQPFVNLYIMLYSCFNWTRGMRRPKSRTQKSTKVQDMPPLTPVMTQFIPSKDGVSLLIDAEGIVAANKDVLFETNEGVYPHNADTFNHSPYSASMSSVDRATRRRSSSSSYGMPSPRSPRSPMTPSSPFTPSSASRFVSEDELSGVYSSSRFESIIEMPGMEATDFQNADIFYDNSIV